MPTKLMTYNTTASFGGANFPFSTVSFQKTQDMVDTTTTADGGYESVTPGLIHRNASLTVYQGTSNMTLPTLGARGTFSWTGAGNETFPARVEDISYGQAQVNGAIPITIKFKGDGNDPATP